MKKEVIPTAYSMLLIVKLISFIIPLSIILSYCSNTRLSAEEDFYYSRGKKMYLKTPLDSIGVLLRNKPGNDTLLQQKFQAIGYTYVRSLSKDIVIVVPANNISANKQELINRGIELPSKDSNLVEKAGYMTRRKDGVLPVIVTPDFIVEFKKQVTKKQVSDLFDKYKVKVLYQNPSIPQQYVLNTTAHLNFDAVKASRLFAEDSTVLYAHPNFIIVKKYLGVDPSNDTFYGRQWYHDNTGQVSIPGTTATVDADIDTDLAWKFTSGDSSTIIAILDEGFDTLHTDLTTNFSLNPGELETGFDNTDNDNNTYTDDIIGWNFRGWCQPVVGDEKGCNKFYTLDENDTHGTAVMGMAASADNTDGLIGSCPGCSVIPIQCGSNVDQDILAFDYAKYRQAKIISCSWLYEDEVIPEAIESSIKNVVAAGITVFFAIDNVPGVQCTSPNDVSSLFEVIAVSRSSNKDLFYFDRPVDPEYNAGYGDSMDLLAPGGSEFGEAEFNTMQITTPDLTGNIGKNRGADPNCGNGDRFDYYYCWTGSSFATPLAAGVAGLILSLDNSIKPKEIQYLLQDCADKIQPSFGYYSRKNGFSNPAGPATHGWGRLNAYEAVKIVAPVSSPGGRGGIDIFLRDNHLDWGNTEQPSSVSFEATRGTLAHWISQDIKVDAPPFEEAGDGTELIINTNQRFMRLHDEDPKGGEKNRIYVRVRNRGYKTVPDAFVKVHWVDAAGGLPILPADFWTEFPANSSDVSVWHPLSQQSISNLRYSGSSLAGFADDDGSQIVMFEFVAPLHDNSRPDNHYCISAVIYSPDDVMPTPELLANPQNRSMDYVTKHFNNASHRNYAIRNDDEPFEGEFFVHNPYKVDITTILEVVYTKPFPVVFKDSIFRKSLRLKQGEKRLVSFRIDPRGYSGEEVSIRQLVISKKDTVVLGGFDYRINSPVAGRKAWKSLF